MFTKVKNKHIKIRQIEIKLENMRSDQTTTDYVLERACVLGISSI